jgi:hypothetical protein
MTGQTFAVWIDDLAKESACEETTEGVVLIKDTQAKVIGFEPFRYRPADRTAGLVMEAVE